MAEYLVDLNATAAAIRAGYSEKTARFIGAENLTKPNIAAEIAKRRIELQSKLEITQEKVLRELAKLGFFDIRKLFGNDGKPLDISKLGDDTASALVGLDVQDVVDNDGDYVGFIKKYKMADKIRALELLGKHLGVFDSRSGQGPARENNLLEAIMSAGEVSTDDLPEVE